MKRIKVLFILSLFCSIAYGQSKFTTRNAHVQFFSNAPLEDIKATSDQARGGVDLENNQILFIVPIKSFEFKKKLMQKHFNEQYLESDKFPTAKFEGSFSKPLKINSQKPQLVKFNGTITIHGVTKEISEEVKITLQQNEIKAHSEFILKTKDFKIKIPRILIKNIAEEIEVEIKANLKQIKP